MPVPEFAWERPISLNTHPTVARSNAMRALMSDLRSAAREWLS